MSEGIYKYTPTVQLKILALLWRDAQSYTLYKETIKPKYFTKSTHIDLCRIIFDYYDKYKKCPTKDALVEEVSLMCSKTSSKQKIIDDYLSTINTMSELNLEDIDYIKDKILSFGKRQALVDAVLESAEILEKKPDTQYNQIEKIVKDAILVGEDVNDLGIDLYDNIEERFNSYLEEEDVIERIPTGIDKLDWCLGGGVGRGEMLVTLAPPGRGKTTTLISMGGNAVDEGYNVLHISMENNEKQIMRNYDMRLLEKDIEYIKANVQSSISAMMNIKKYKKGRLKIKRYPARSASVRTIRNLLDQLKTVEEFVPDVLIVDYGAILKPSFNFADKRNSIETIYEELRAVATEYDLALLTGAQGNRGALSKRVVTMADLAECFAIANTADIMVCLCQTQKEKINGDMRMFLSKVRDSADSMILKGKIMYDIKKITMDEIVDQTAEAEDEDAEDDNDDDDWS